MAGVFLENWESLSPSKGSSKLEGSLSYLLETHWTLLRQITAHAWFLFCHFWYYPPVYLGGYRRDLLRVFRPRMFYSRQKSLGMLWLFDWSITTHIAVERSSSIFGDKQPASRAHDLLYELPPLEQPVTVRHTRQYDPEDLNRHQHLCQNLKFNIYIHFSCLLWIVWYTCHEYHSIPLSHQLRGRARQLGIQISEERNWSLCCLQESGRRFDYDIFL